VARTAAAEENMKGPGRKNVHVERHEVTMALANGVGVVTVQAKLPVLMRTRINERHRDAEEEVFVCLGQMVLRKQVDESVKLSRTEAVGKVGGWGANESASVIVATAKLKEGEAAVVLVVVEKLEVAAVAAVVERLGVVVVVVAVVESLVVAVVADGKIMMA
jgi:hypothetical protein